MGQLPAERAGVTLNSEILSILSDRGADFTHFVDISGLAGELNRGYPGAILIGMVLSRGYVRKIMDTPDYVERMVRSCEIHMDEFHLKEVGTDRLADELTDRLAERGHEAFSQSEGNLTETGLYSEGTRTSPLPHKTIALMAGLGWIGKNNLLVTREFGSAVSMCTVLTDAPLDTVRRSPAESLCGSCETCIDACLPGALKGRAWEAGIPRDEMLDVDRCVTCLRCMALCPWTVRYAAG